MKGWLLDTNVVSELRKAPARLPCEGMVGYASGGQFLSQQCHACHDPFRDRAPSRFGVPRRTRNRADPPAETLVAGRIILPMDEEVILEWRRMVTQGKKQRPLFSQPDLFIAATAQVHSRMVCTRNEQDFRRIGVPVFSPWSE